MDSSQFVNGSQVTVSGRLQNIIVSSASVHELGKISGFRMSIAFMVPQGLFSLPRVMLQYISENFNNLLSYIFSITYDIWNWFVVYELVDCHGFDCKCCWSAGYDAV